MPSQQYNPGHLAPAHPTYGSHYIFSSSQSASRQRPVHQSSKRKQPETHHSRRLPIIDNGMQRPLEDVTDRILVGDDSWSPTAQPSSESQVVISQQVDGVGWTQVHEEISVPRLQCSTHVRESLKIMSGAGVEDGDRALPLPPSPPTTPQLRRLTTPELEPENEVRLFCTCCRRMNVSYQQGREKLDLEREFVTSVSLGVRDVVTMTKHC